MIIKQIRIYSVDVLYWDVCSKANLINTFVLHTVKSAYTLYVILPGLKQLLVLKTLRLYSFHRRILDSRSVLR